MISQPKYACFEDQEEQLPMSQKSAERPLVPIAAKGSSDPKLPVRRAATDVRCSSTSTIEGMPLNSPRRTTPQVFVFTKALQFYSCLLENRGEHCQFSEPRA